MILILKYIAKLMKALASEATPNQLAAGFILGMIVGLTPLMSLYNLLVLIIILVVKVNLGFAVLAFFIFTCVSNTIDEKCRGILNTAFHTTTIIILNTLLKFIGHHIYFKVYRSNSSRSAKS